MPSACSAEDLETQIYTQLKSSLPFENVDIGVHITEQMCSTNQPKPKLGNTPGYLMARYLIPQ